MGDSDQERQPKHYIEGESAIGSCSASSKLGSTWLSPPDNPSLPASPKTFILGHS